MGSLPQLSVLKGTSRTGAKDQLNRIFENNVDKLFGHNIATKYNGKWMNEREKRKNVITHRTSALHEELFQKI